MEGKFAELSSSTIGNLFIKCVKLQLEFYHPVDQ